MSDVIIRSEGLGKSYRIRRARQDGYVALRDVIADKARAALRFGRRGPDQAPEMDEFWALKDVSFDIRQGEVVGIIGRNGAGKSTLLKVLSRITEPSAGRVELDGRVASLLEVGTGFHPELTGRENIYLNGAILGMARAEIRARFDEIVEFAGVATFLDTPVKRYSSGMYVRLAFSVAAHMDPEILIVDEVLAVGDAEFQKKCLGRMSAVARGGRTVLFVSHNMGAIRSLTQRCLVLEKGRVHADCPSGEAVDLYMKAATPGVAGGDFVRTDPRDAGQPFYVQRVTLRGEPGGTPADWFDCDHPVYVCMEFTASRPVPGLYGYMTLQRADGTVVYEGDSFDRGGNPFSRLVPGSGAASIRIPPRVLGPGTYNVYLSFASGSDVAGPEVDVPGIVGEFTLEDTSTRRGNDRDGYLSMTLDWEVSGPADSNLPANRT